MAYFLSQEIVSVWNCIANICVSFNYYIFFILQQHINYYILLVAPLSSA